MKVKVKKILFCFGFILVIIFTICGMEETKFQQTMQTSTKETQENLSNKKIGWGIKRNDNHEQPDLGEVNKSILEKYEGICMGNKEKKYIYLTFDEGYEAGYTEKILEVLKQNDVKAAFFLTAHYVNTRPDLVQKMIDEGHTIGNHTVNHKSMPDLDEETIKKEVMDLHTAVYEKFGYEMKFIRPPKGEYSQRSIACTNKLGYTTVMWSFAYDDWDEKKQDREAYAKEKILKNVHNGEVMLLHGNSKDNTNVLDSCIKEIKQMGYEFRMLEQFEK